MAEAQLCRPSHPGLYSHDCRAHIASYCNDSGFSPDVGARGMAEEGLVRRLPDVTCDGLYPGIGTTEIGDANTHQVFSIGTTILVIMASQLYGWDRHVWDLLPVTLEQGRKVRLV